MTLPGKPPVLKLSSGPDELASYGKKVVKRGDPEASANVALSFGRGGLAAIYPRQAVLIVGCLLRDSEVALAVRRMLTDLGMQEIHKTGVHVPVAAPLNTGLDISSLDPDLLAACNPHSEVIQAALGVQQARNTLAVREGQFGRAMKAVAVMAQPKLAPCFMSAKNVAEKLGYDQRSIYKFLREIGVIRYCTPKDAGQEICEEYEDWGETRIVPDGNGNGRTHSACFFNERGKAGIQEKVQQNKALAHDLGVL
jgi:hypothetical protein